MKTIEEIVIDALEPTFADMMETNTKWHGYGMELCYLMGIFLSHPNCFVDEVNTTLIDYTSNTGEYTAACDVASTLESLAPEKYAGKFRY